MGKRIARDMTVRQVIVQHPGVRRILEGHGIDTCCGGDQPLGRAADELGVDFEELVRELQEALAAPPAVDDGRDWTQATVTELVDHIERTHHAFLHEIMPRIAERIEKVLSVHGERHGRLLREVRSTFRDLSAEINQHLLKEEQILFPLMRQTEAFLVRGGARPEYPCGSMRNPVRQMEFEHHQAGDALARMRLMTSRYRLPGDACEAFGALYDDLQALEADLKEHIHLENNILFPRAVEMEAAVARV